MDCVLRVESVLPCCGGLCHGRVHQEVVPVCFTSDWCMCVCVVDREWVVVCESHQEETRYTAKYTCSCSVCVDMSVVVVLGHECAANARLFVSFIYGE